MVAFLLMSKINFGMAALSDPTLPQDYVDESSLAKKSDHESLFTVSAILISENHKIAVINNHIVKIGDKLGDNEVKEIMDNEVKLIDQKKGILTLRLINKAVKEKK